MRPSSRRYSVARATRQRCAAASRSAWQTVRRQGGARRGRRHPRIDGRGRVAPAANQLQGIDAPELGEVFGREAQTFRRSFVAAQEVRVSGRDIDRYGRLVARVSNGGQGRQHGAGTRRPRLPRLREGSGACARGMASPRHPRRVLGAGCKKAGVCPDLVQREAPARVSAAARTSLRRDLQAPRPARLAFSKLPVTVGLPIESRPAPVGPT